MTSSSLKALDKFRSALHMGAGIADYEIANLRDLIIRSVKYFRNQQKASEVVRQMGWTPHNTFCFGTYEIHRDGTITTVLNRPEVRQLMQAVRVSGDVAVGIQAFREASAFWCTPGYEYGGMALAVTFAAPLLHVGGVISGGLIHCYSPLSGRGKSAIQLACLSAWGETDKLIALPSDTGNSTMHHINMLGSLPMVIEEITKMSVEDTGNMVYQLTHGREKRRMDGSTYTNKPMMGNYRTLTLTSGNSSLLDKALAGSSAPDGLMYRIIELRMDTPLPHTLDMESMLTRMMRNHGAVGAKYITWVATHYDQVKAMLRAAVADMEDHWGIEKHERYWREIIASMLVGMQIANDLNVASFDLPVMRAWIKAWYVEYKARVRALLVAARDVLLVIISRHIKDTVFVMKNDVGVMQTGGSAMISYNHNTRELWVSAVLLQGEVTKMNVDILMVTDAMVSPTFTYQGAREAVPADKLISGMGMNATIRGYVYTVTDTQQLPVAYA